MALNEYKLFTKQQERIHKGLKEIGHSLADFYEDAIRVSHPSCTLKAKSNLITHLAREIDSGIREVFSPGNLKVEMLKLVEPDQGNFASILAAVGKPDPNNAFAKEWFKISKQLHKYAHRRPAHLPSRDPKEALSLWVRYEQILSQFLGSFYSLLQRLDQFLEMDIAPVESLPALKNILSNEKQAAYFFGKMNKIGWLETLKNEGYFDIINAPIKSEETGEIKDWYAIRTLVNLSVLKDPNVDVNIKNILDPIMIAYTEGKIDLYAYSIASISKTLIQLDTIGFHQKEVSFFESLSKRNDQNTLFYAFYLVEELPKKLLAKKDNASLVNFLMYAFGFSTHTVPGISMFEMTTDDRTAVRPNMETSQLSVMMNKNGKAIMDFVGQEFINIVADSITRLESIEDREFSVFSLASIEDTDQTQFSTEWDHALTRIVRDYAVLLNPKILSDFLDVWLNGTTETLQRLAIHFIRIHFDQFANKWWSFIESDNEGLYKHETYLLIKETSRAYNAEQLTKLIAWLERTNKVEPWEGQTMDQAQSSRDFKIREYLEAINEENSEIKQTVEKLKADYLTKNNWKIEHPEFDGYSTFRVGPDMPIEPNTFEKMELAAQLGTLNNFIAPAHEPTSYEGLAHALEYSVSKTPEKYLFDLDQFMPVHSVYLKGLLQGFSSAITNEKIIAFEPIIDFLSKKIASPEFAEEKCKGHHDKLGFVYRIETFITTLVKSNKLEISKEKIEEIISLIIALLENPEFQDNSDKITQGYLNHSINSLQGRLLGALIETCSLYVNKFVDEKELVKWPQSAKQYFTNKLTRTTNADKDFSIILGSRLQALNYFDSAWVIEHFKEIFNIHNPQHYEYTFATAINGFYRIDKTLFNLLNDNHIFEEALDRYPEATGTLSQVMSYAIHEWQFRGINPEDKKGIIHEILQRSNPNHFQELIEVTFKSKYLSFPLVKKLWELMLKAAEGKHDFEKVYPNLLWLAEVHHILDEDIHRLSLKTIDKVVVGSKDVYSFTRHIYQLADTKLKLAAEIVLRLFEKGITQPYYDTELQKFVRKLFENDMKEMANEICKLVSDMGAITLKDIFDEFNK